MTDYFIELVEPQEGIDACRAAFEAHTESLPGFKQEMLNKRPTGSYFNSTIHAAWEGWKAAYNTRADLCPKPAAMTEGEIFKLIALQEIKAGKELRTSGTITEIIRALKAAGVLSVREG